MAELNTLSNFAYRYRAASNYAGGTVNTIAFGTSWKDDAGANDLSGNTQFPANVNWRSRTQLSSIRANTGGIVTRVFKTAGTSINVRNMGFVFVGQWAMPPNNIAGTPQTRAIINFGTTGGGGVLAVRMSVAGKLTLSTASNANPIEFGTLRIPAGPTAILVNSGAGGTWAKILGLTGEAGGIHAGTSNNAWVRLFEDEDGQSVQRGHALVDELAMFSASTTVQAKADEIEADVISRYSLTTPTVGHIVCIGTSLGCGDYHGLARFWPGEVAASLPEWFTVNNSVEGQTFAQALTDIATLGTAATDRPLGTTKPEVIFVELGANEVFNSVSLATLKTNAEAFISALRTAKPRAVIVVCTVVVIGSTAAKNTVRTGYNSWLLAGGLAAYNVRVADIASYDATFTPASNTDADVNTCTGTANFTTTDLANTVGAGDHVHWSLVGINRLYPAFVTAATAAAAAARGGAALSFYPGPYARWV